MANRYIEKYVQCVRMDGLKTKLPAVFSSNVTVTGTLTASGTVVSGGLTNAATQALGTTGTIAVTPTSTILTSTPTGNVTYNFAAGAIGAEVWIIVTTSGASSYTITLGTNVKSTGTLATGTSTGKVFVVNLLSDGTSWYEVSRTTAM